MVYFEDTGTLIAAPLEFVWEYLVSEHHGPAHAKSARHFEVRETIGATAVIAAERFLDGHWKRFVSRSTDFPPFCVCNEEIEGDFAGTKFVLLYRPVGGQTQVDVFGDVQSTEFPPEVAKRRFLGLLEAAYLDDLPVLLELRRVRAAARDPAGAP
jgi:hypothetical protein